MKIEHIKYTGVKHDGTFEDEPGAIITTGAIRMGQGEGCSLENCKCSEGHWITIISPRDSYGVVNVMKCTFEDAREMDTFLKHHEVSC